MIHLELQDFSSADVDKVWEWKPASPADVCFQLALQIGEKGKAGGHWFQAVVATPEGLMNAAKKIPGYQIPERALMVFSAYSWEAVLTRVNKILKLSSRPTWNLSMVALQRYFIWEYEDMDRPK